MSEENGKKTDEGAGEHGNDSDLIPPPLDNGRASLLKILFAIGGTIAVVSTIIILRPSSLPSAARKLLFSPFLAAANIGNQVGSGVRKTGEQLRRARGAIQRKATPADSPDFRVGEDRLVRWAQEDLGVETLSGGGDEDMMVNDNHRALPLEPVVYSQDDEEDWNRFADGDEDVYGGRGEYIPLKPSPALGRLPNANTASGKKGRGYWFRYGYGTIG